MNREAVIAVREDPRVVREVAGREDHQIEGTAAARSTQLERRQAEILGPPPDVGNLRRLDRQPDGDRVFPARALAIRWDREAEGARLAAVRLGVSGARRTAGLEGAPCAAGVRHRPLDDRVRLPGRRAGVTRLGPRQR